jgi:hypothetical protein
MNKINPMLKKMICIGNGMAVAYTQEGGKSRVVMPDLVCALCVFTSKKKWAGVRKPPKPVR